MNCTKQLKILSFSVLLFLTLFLNLSVSADEIGGLAFKSSEVLINERTSAHFDLAKIRMKGPFSVRFDLSIWMPDKFGYILTYVHPSGKTINLVHVHYRQNDNSQLEITIPSENKAALIAIPKKKFSKNHWSSIDIQFNPDKNTVALSCDGNRVELVTELGDAMRYGQLYFGRSPQNIDVLSMAVRNIEFVQTDGAKSIQIPLTQNQGTDISDSKGKTVGKVENPSWLISEHLHWHLLADTTCHFNSGIAYDPVQNSILVFSADSIIDYNVNRNSYGISYLSNPVDLEKFYREAAYSETLKTSFVYHFGNAQIGNSVISKDRETGKEQFFSIKESKGKKHHHGMYFNELDSSLYIFGGYGSFSYFNNLNRFSTTTGAWQNVPMTGDTIAPRFFTAMGQAENPGEVFLFGGFGNLSGKQEMGGFNFYDLFRINLATKKSKKIADFSTQLKDKFVVLNQLIYNDKNNELYALGFTHHQVNAKLQMYRIRLSDNTISAVADTIPMMSEKIQSNAFLYFDRENSRLLCVVKEWAFGNTAKLKIYSLASPPLNEAVFLESNVSFLRLLLIIVIALIAGAVFVYLKARNAKKRQLDNVFQGQAAQDNEPEHPAHLAFEARPNSIYTFGGFAAFDKKGKDISYRFSVRLKHFFALLLLKSYSEREGLDSHEICSILWPDKDLSSAKNLRGVTANQLKSILADIEGVSLEKSESGKWIIKVEAPAYCDYVYVLNHYIKNKTVDTASILPVLSNGMFFPFIQTTWIDKSKSDFESLILNTLPKELQQLITNQDFSNVVKATSVLLLYDPLNNEFVATKLAALVKLGKQTAAKQAFEQFKADFQNSYGNVIILDIKEFIQRHALIKLI